LTVKGRFGSAEDFLLDIVELDRSPGGGLCQRHDSGRNPDGCSTGNTSDFLFDKSGGYFNK
jgi:hypothetical protein